MRRLFALCAVVLVALAACDEPPAAEPYARGAQLFRKLDCGRCHFIDGQGGRIAPELTHVGTNAASRAAGVSAEDYIRRSIQDPGSYIVPGFQDIMPRGLARNLSTADLDALVLYLSRHE